MNNLSLPRPSCDGEFMWEQKTNNGIKRGFVKNLKLAKKQKGATVWAARCGGWIALKD